LKSKGIAFGCCILLICCLFCSCSKEKVKAITPQQKKLNVLYVTDDVFKSSVSRANDYPKTGGVICGVVPHHLVAANLIAGFFKSIAQVEYDTVIIIAPDHKGGSGQAITSKLNWNVNGSEVLCDTDLSSQIMKTKNLKFVTDNNRLQNDHSASNLVPM